MSSSSQTYRVCWFDGAAKTVSAELIEAASDEQAIAAVETAGYGTKCELWAGRRLVAQIDGERLQA